MLLTEAEAKKKVCMIFLEGSLDQMHGGRYKKESKCLGSECMTYWRWADETHVEGYCGIVGRPEIR